MKRFLQILGVVALGLVVLIALGALFAYSGFYNVAATNGQLHGSESAQPHTHVH